MFQETNASNNKLNPSRKQVDKEILTIIFKTISKPIASYAPIFVSTLCHNMVTTLESTKCTGCIKTKYKIAISKCCESQSRLNR